VPDDGDFLALDDGEVRVFVVEDLGHGVCSLRVVRSRYASRAARPAGFFCCGSCGLDTRFALLDQRLSVLFLRVCGGGFETIRLPRIPQPPVQFLRTRSVMDLGPRPMASSPDCAISLMLKGSST